MVAIVEIIRLMVGLALLIVGGSFIRESPRMGGFLVGGLAAVEVVIRVMTFTGIWIWIGPLLAFLLGGLVGALLGTVLSMFMLVIYTSLLGAVVGFILGLLVMMGGSTQQIIDSVLEFSSIDPIQSAFMVVFALLFGFLAIRFQEFMAMASTAFLGSALAMIAMATQLRRFAPIFREDVVLLFIWVVLGMFGLIWQNNSAKN
jgi:hypothetical protein